MSTAVVSAADLAQKWLQSDNDKMRVRTPGVSLSFFQDSNAPDSDSFFEAWVQDGISPRRP
jgi:hypothetical protein